MEGRSFYRFLLDAGYPEDRILSYRSDLYVEKTPQTQRMLDDWLSERGFSSAALGTLFVGEFVDQITGEKMYDVAFQYEPYWKKIAEEGAE